MKETGGAGRDRTDDLLSAIHPEYVEPCRDTSVSMVYARRDLSGLGCKEQNIRETSARNDCTARSLGRSHVRNSVSVARMEGQHTARGTEVTLPTNQDMASQIGTVRELISRNLSRFQAEGLLRLDGRRAIIPDVDALAPTADHIGT
jgi:CRP-like cAMP-binding protein